MKPPASSSLLLATLLLGCVNVVTIDSSDGGPGANAVVVCAGTRCATGSLCCLFTGRCFDPVTERATCTVPQDAGGLGSMGDPGQPACVSNADCDANEYCWVRMNYYQGCRGIGVCQLRSNGSGCVNGATGRRSPDCPVCGCDGVTYFGEREATNAGVNSHPGRCGVAPGPPRDGGPVTASPSTIPCGLDSQCPTGSACCSITGFCYDPACVGCCQIPPLGTVGPCERSSDCPSGWPFCRGGPACNGPGFCVGPEGNCGGQVSPVCGCDGVTYTNHCWAERALTRVAHAGACE